MVFVVAAVVENRAKEKTTSLWVFESKLMLLLMMTTTKKKKKKTGRASGLEIEGLLAEMLMLLNYFLPCFFF